MALITITKDNYEDVAVRSKGTVLLDFYADWCGACKIIAPILEEIAAENPDFTVGKINVDNESELSDNFGITSIPALFVMKNGKVTEKTVGAAPKEQILALLK